LISQTSYNLTIDILPEGLKFLDLGEHPLKGLKRPDNIFQLIAAGLPTKFPPLILSDQDEKQPIQLPAFLAEGHEIEVQEAVFVGRDLELERLNKYLEDALHGQGNVAFISGGPGRGKTSLIEAFIRHSTQTHSNLLVCFGNCNAHSGVGDGYLPFRQVLDMLAGDVEAHWSSGKLSGEQAQRLWENVPNTLRCITELGPDLIDVFVPGEKLLNWSQSYAPKDNLLGSELEKLVYQKTHFGNPTEVNQVNLFEQYSRALLAISKQQPVLVVLDDLQWADTASTSLLFYLGRIVKDGQMLILGAYRPDEVAFGRGGERHPLEKVLHELHRIYGDVDVDLTQEGRGREFIDKLLDSEPNKHSANFRQSLFNHTGGHPLFTLELLRSMQERGVLGLNNQGYWEEQAPINWNSLPVRVEAVIEERISRLEDELLETLTIASVEGEDFTAQVVAQIQEVKERQLLKALSRELDKKHRLVQELGEWKVTGHFLQRYRFAHQLFQRYLYNNLSSGERRLLHNEIANILEDFYAGSADLYAIQLSYHYLRAGITDKALDYLIKAGQQAKEKYANEEAIGFFNSANDQLLILLSEETSQSDIWAPTTILIHENMADVLAMIGQYDKAKEAYKRPWIKSLRMNLFNEHIYSKRLDRYGKFNAATMMR